MRLKNLTLSYNLPKQWISKLSLSSVQVYVQGDNLFTIHRNQGLDPEQGITGITYYRYPAMKNKNTIHSCSCCRSFSGNEL